MAWLSWYQFQPWSGKGPPEEAWKMWAKAKAVGLVLLVSWAVIPLGGFGGNGAKGPAAKPPEFYLLSFRSPDSIRSLSNLGIEIVADYSNGYYLARGSSYEGDYLRGLGIEVQGIPDRTIIRFPDAGYEFDTGTGTPDLPPQLRAVDTDERIVQFVGPIKSEWVKAAENTGAVLEQYVESFAFITRMSDAQADAVRSLPFVNWVGPYEPAYKVQSELLGMKGEVQVSVVAHDGVSEAGLREVLEGLGADVIMTWDMPVTAEVRLDASLAPAVARLPDVLSVMWSPEQEPTDWAADEIHGVHEAWIPLRSGIPANLTGHSPGPDGVMGTADDVYEVVGIQDTGLDRNDPLSGHPDFYSGPLGNRVVAIRRQTAGCNQPDGFMTGDAHGTYVAGIAVSNGFAWEQEHGLPTDDFVWDESEAGVAPEGMISFDCIVVGGGGVSPSPSYWDSEYADGAKTMSNSWAGGSTAYDAMATAVDARIDASNDKMIVFSVGNGGPWSNTVSGSSKGKNGLAIGAAQSYRPIRSGADDPGLVADFSSRGSGFERFKPDLVAAGTALVGPLGYGEFTYYTFGGPDWIYGPSGVPMYKFANGVSQTSALAAGVYMLTREYFRETWGIDNVDSQLAKALLINGAVRMNPDLHDYPGIDQGWGRIDIEQSLFPSAPRTNQWEVGSFTTTGSWQPTNIYTSILSSDVPLKVTLVWIDAPGNSLARNLNLVVRTPNGTVEYHGNQYATAGPLKGWTDPSDPGFDTVNNVEQVEVRYPTPGMWSVEVRGVSIPSTAKFALVFSADTGTKRTYQVSVSTGSETAMKVAPGGSTHLPFTVTSFGGGSDYISVFDNASGDVSTSYDWTGADFGATQSRGNNVTFTATPTAGPGVHPILVCAKSTNDATIPPASDCLQVQVIVDGETHPPVWNVTSGGRDEMDPSVLTFTQEGVNRVFVAYREITALNYSDMAHGGSNVWVAHNTLNESGQPNGMWAQQRISDLNDNPRDIRIIRIDNGTFTDRVVITWGGEDPLEPNPDLRPYGRIAFSDPPYTNWTVRTIEKNWGSQVYNAMRTGFPVFRKTPSPNGTLVWVWEHLDYVSAGSTSVAAVQTHAAFSGDGGNSWSDCTAGQCRLIAPPSGNPNFYFYPNGVVDQNDVLWVFFYWRALTSQYRKLGAVLWDGPTRSVGWTNPISIWDPGTAQNITFPYAVSTSEGGNRVYVASVVDDGAGTPKRIYVTYAEGTYGSGIVGPPPVPSPPFGISASFSMPQGPMGGTVLTGRSGEGPVLNAVHTDGGLTWVPYMEQKSIRGWTDMWTWRSPDGFVNRGAVNVTLDTYAKGHQMSDVLTLGWRSCVYEVWHENREPLDRVNYDIRLAVYCVAWQGANDTRGPLTLNPSATPNPYDKAYSTSLEVAATISDVSTGMSNITAAQMAITDTTVNDPALVDWSAAWAMNLSGYDRNPVETAWLWANGTAAGWPVGSCHRLWIRGEDRRSNWGNGAFVDVCVIATPHPPTMTKAELTGTGYGDVTLTWSKSADDGGGTNSVVSYKVSRSESLRGPFTAVANVAATGSATYTWRDVGAGHGNPRDFFYYVVASSASTDSQRTRFAGKFFRAMDGGKQLMSFPLEQADYDPAVVFQTFGYTYARTYVAGTPNPWWSHKPGRLINSLTELSVLQGYWVQLDGPGTMSVAGLVPESVVMSLKSGWNMIGFPSFNESYTFADLDVAIGGSLQLVEIYDPTAGPYYLQKVLRNAWSTTYMLPGFAYMVRVSSDVSWLVPNM